MLSTIDLNKERIKDKHDNKNNINKKNG